MTAPLTHQARAEHAARVVGALGSQREPPSATVRLAPGEWVSPADAIARLTLPTELLEAARKMLKIIRSEHRYRERRFGQDFAGPEITEAESALALYPEEPPAVSGEAREQLSRHRRARGSGPPEEDVRGRDTR